MITSESVAFEHVAKAQELVLGLLDARTQFSVALYPQQIDAPKHDGWIISYMHDDKQPNYQTAAA